MSDRRRTALALVLLMIIAPLTSAATTSWTGPTSVNPPDEGITLTGFRVPGNATIQDGWLHVTDTEMTTSLNPGILWEGSDLDSGIFYGTDFIDSTETITLLDDGTRSNISTFDTGVSSVSMHSSYTYSPGWRYVYSTSSSTSVSDCNNLSGTWVDHGYDNNFNQNLDSNEIIDTLMYCSGNALEDSVTTLDVNEIGYGYSAGTLSATGGSGSGFSGTYTISSAISSISVNNGGSGYAIGDNISFVCPGGCTGSNATASVGSIASNGSIITVTISNGGSGYTSQTMYLLVSSSGGSGASLSEVLETTGSVYEAFVTDGGSGYTSSPTIVISSSGGSSANITAGLGGFFDYEVSIDSITAGSSANCMLGGYEVNAGMDTDEDSTLDSNEITDTNYLCNIEELWQATTFSDLNGTNFGGEQTMSYGTIPTEASQGIVSVGTMPGSALPRGTSGYFLLPQVTLPNSGSFSGLYMTFDHWHHLDSPASGGGDGAWIEYRINTGTWNDWTYIAPDSNALGGGYTSTMSTDAPSPNGAPSGAVPVFASPNHSGWLNENVSISSISDINNASKIQFRFHIWTSPNASYERPGWFIDNIDFNNDGVNTGVWHHGCISATGSACQYVANSYGALQRTIDLSGTNSSSSIEIDMEWDLQGSTSDNACIELSLNNVTWYDLSSTGTTATTASCEDRQGAIPGYPSYDGVFGDQSNGIRTVDFSIPSAYQNQQNVYMRFVVDTDGWTNYGGSTADTKEGFTLSDIRVLDDSGSILFQDDIENPSTMSHYSVNTGYDDWAYYTLIFGSMEELFNFEDSTASDPTSSNAPGWSKGTGWGYGQLGSAAGPSDPPSFPYVYGTNLNGNYANNLGSYLTSPTYEIPTDGLAYLTFDKWVCTETYWDAVGLMIKVNNGAWNYFDPQIPGWYDGSPGYTGNSMSGSDAWMNGDCGQTNFENRIAPLSSYSGDTLRFRFHIDTDTSVQYQGGYFDNFGILISNYGEGGYWLSPSINMDDIDTFNHGWIDIEASIPENTSIRGSLVDASDNSVIPGYDNITFPFSLAGVDSEQYSQIKLKVIMDTSDEESTPQLERISIGGKRYLSATGSDYNGWEFSPSIEVLDGLLNATSIAGTITSDFIHSSRPIKSVTLSGNFSSGLMIEALSSTGANLGQTSQGSIPFQVPQNGFALSISLPTNGWIDRMVISANFAEPALNPSIDVINDGSSEWSFPMGYDYGHYGWQSLISDNTETYTRSTSLELDGSGIQSSFMIRLPSLAAVNNGMISIAPDSDGLFETPVTLTIGSSSQTSYSTTDVFNCILDASQVSGINSLSTSHIDSETGREWRDVSVSLSSNSAQTVSISSIGIGYLIFENVSGLGTSVSEYHSSMTQDDPPPNQVSIPVNITAEMGSISIDGDLKFDYIVTNRDFQVPNTLYPNGELVEITTKHHHLFDNSNLQTIQLLGIASDGEVLRFEAVNGADGLWGQGSDAVTFSQLSGSSVAPMDSSTSIEIITHNDGYDDVVVHWKFDISWMWDDVGSIRWVSQAFDSSGESVWPSVSHSGHSGKNAVENDLIIDSFEVRDEFGRLLSNQYSSFYPYTMIDAGELNITGTVKFQDSSAVRPMSDHYTVGLNISGLSYLLTSGEDGYSGLISAPSGLSNVYLSPMMNTVGPTGYSLGAEDVTGTPPLVNIRVDHEPPVSGPLEVNTPSGLKAAHGKVWSPNDPLSLFVTVDESEARGELLTLNYWRGSVDDLNGDGIADEDEYLSVFQPLTPSMTGQQQVNFIGIDVSQQSFNSPVHMYLEGTDWAGLSYQDGGTGGGPGASNSWATVVVATDEPTSIKSAGYSLDRDLGFLLPGKQHTFTMQIEEANGLNTLDNISIMLCGDGTTELGKMSYDPSRGTIWSDETSQVIPISVQTTEVTADIVQLSMIFEMSWNYPWDESQNSCKPSVSIVDDFSTVAYQNNIGELSWYLDNRYVAIPEMIEDLTPPSSLAAGTSVYLGQGDEFRMSGHVYHSGSGVIAMDVPADLKVEYTVVYGTQEIQVVTDVNEDGSFDTSMILPSRVPLNPTMDVQTEVLNLPGLGESDHNSDASVTVDSKSPTVLFDQSTYPDSSLVLLESDLISDVLVTVTMVDEIGMNEGPLEVSWVILRSGVAVAGSENTGQLIMIDDGETKDVYESNIDFTPLNGMTIEQGDQIAFWVTSTDRAGNKVTGLGSESAPRMPTLRIMEFNPEFSRVVINPSNTPVAGQMLTLQTFWENDGKRDGSITVGLYELNPVENTWSPALTTLADGDTEIILGAQSSSVIATFQWESWQEGQPLLVLIMQKSDGEMDWDNSEGQNIDLSGINVQPLPIEQESDTTLYLVIGVAVIAVCIVAFVVMRSRGDDEYYYDDEEDDDWEYEDDDDSED